MKRKDTVRYSGILAKLTQRLANEENINQIYATNEHKMQSK